MKGKKWDLMGETNSIESAKDSVNMPLHGMEMKYKKKGNKYEVFSRFK